MRQRNTRRARSFALVSVAGLLLAACSDYSRAPIDVSEGDEFVASVFGIRHIRMWH